MAGKYSSFRLLFYSDYISPVLDSPVTVIPVSMSTFEIKVSERHNHSTLTAAMIAHLEGRDAIAPAFAIDICCCSIASNSPVVVKMNPY